MIRTHNGTTNTVKLVDTTLPKLACSVMAFIVFALCSQASLAAPTDKLNKNAQKAVQSLMTNAQKDAYEDRAIEISKALVAAAIENIPTGKCYISKDKSVGYFKVNDNGKGYLWLAKRILTRLNRKVYIYRMDNNYFMCNKPNKKNLGFAAFVQMPLSSEFFTCPLFYKQTDIQAALTIAHEIGHMAGVIGQRHVVVEPTERLIRLCSLVEQERITGKPALVDTADFNKIHKDK